jgi:uncharacterized protein YebE (UPF0316 family)
MDVILWALFIFVFRMANVALGTVRTLLVMRGERILATSLGFVEALFFVVAVGKAVQDLGNLVNLLAYCVGFAAGTWVGMILENRLALGYVLVHIVSLQKGRRIALALREKGYGVTEMLGEGRAGRVGIIDVVAKRKDVPLITSIGREVDGNAFITVQEPREVYRGYIPGVR